MLHLGLNRGAANVIRNILSLVKDHQVQTLVDHVCVGGGEERERILPHSTSMCIAFRFSTVVRWCPWLHSLCEIHMSSLIFQMVFAVTAEECQLD